MEDGGPAFPLEHSVHCRGCHQGMSLRDYFACHIIQGLLTPGGQITIADAEKAYQAATAMVEARKKDYIV
jgi:hypothetical protein